MGYKILELMNTQFLMNFFFVYSCISIARIKEIKPTLSYIKASVKYMHNYGKFSFQMKDKEHIFTQRWGIYIDN